MAYPLHVRADEIDNRGDIVIGNDFWIGRNILLRSGITIGSGVVVATGHGGPGDVARSPSSVVSPPGPIGRRFADEQLAGLLAVRWWHWSDEEILLVRERSVVPGARLGPLDFP